MHDPQNNTTARWLHLAALALMLLYFGWHAVGHAVPVGVAGPQCDNLTQALPKLHFYVNELRAGRWPTWDPYSGAGSADYPIRSYVIYPTTLVTALTLPPWAALLADTALAFLLAYFFAYALLRRSDAEPVAAWAGALALAFGGLNLRYLFYPYFSQTAAWVPLVFVAVDGLFAQRPRRAGAVALGALAVGMMILAGMLQYLVYTLFFAGIYTLLATAKAPVKRSQRLTSPVLALAFVVLGFALGAARLLPLLDEIDMLRGGYDMWSAFAGLLLTPQQVLASFAPGAFADYGVKMHAATVAYGVAAWSLALAFMLVGKKDRRDWFWLAVLLIGLLTSMRMTPARVLFAALPGFGNFEPSRVWSVAGVALCWLAVRSLGEVGSKNDKLLPVAAGWGVFFLLGLLAMLVLQRSAFSVRHLVPPMFAALALAGLWLRRKKVDANRLALLLAIVLALEVFGRAAVSSERIDTRKLYRETPITQVLTATRSDKRVLRVGDRWGWLRDGRLYTMEALKVDGVEDLHAYSSMIDPYLRDTVDALREHTNYGLNPFDASAAIQPFLTAAPLIAGKTDFLAAPFVLSQREIDGEPALVKRAEHAGLFLYENMNAFPRARFVDGSRWSGYRDGRVGDVDLKRVVVLTPSTMGAGAAAADVPPGEQKPWASVRELERTPTRQEYRVDTTTPGWLVVTERYDFNWRADVNSHNVEIYPANGAFRAVAVPAGESRVIFTYHPTALWTGMKAAAVAAAVIVLLALFSGWARVRASRKNGAAAKPAG